MLVNWPKGCTSNCACFGICQTVYRSQNFDSKRIASINSPFSICFLASLPIQVKYLSKDDHLKVCVFLFVYTYSRSADPLSVDLKLPSKPKLFFQSVCTRWSKGTPRKEKQQNFKKDLLHSFFDQIQCDVWHHGNVFVFCKFSSWEREIKEGELKPNFVEMGPLIARATISLMSQVILAMVSNTSRVQWEYRSING